MHSISQTVAGAIIGFIFGLLSFFYRRVVIDKSTQLIGMNSHQPPPVGIVLAVILLGYLILYFRENDVQKHERVN